MSTTYLPRQITLLGFSLLTLSLATVACGDEEGETVEDLGSVLTDGESKLVVTVPDGAESVAIVIDGAGSRLILADTITSPSGKVVFDFNNDIYTNRTDANTDLYTVLIPNNPEVALEGGDWELTLVTDTDAYEATATSIVKNAPGDNRLNLNLFFVGVEGIDATTAPMDADFQAILTNVGAVYQSAGITIGDITYEDVTNDSLSVVEFTASDTSELFELFKLSAGKDNKALNFFFVKDLIDTANADATQLGQSGGVPGPATIHGTEKSGVVVNLADFSAAKTSGDMTMITEASALTEIIMAHEAGHYLGLYHTTERTAIALKEGGSPGHDHLTDTPECPNDADGNGDGSLSRSECETHDTGNLMFWSPRTDSRTFTSSQSTVLKKNPVVQ